MTNEESFPAVMDINSTATTFQLPPSKLRVFVLYEDFASGIPARWLAGEISSQAKRRCESTTEMWKFDHVVRVGAFQKMTAQEAGEADVLIVAAVSVNEPPAGLTDWFQQLAAWKRHRLSPGLLIGLLGIQSEEDVENSVLRIDLARMAQQTGMTFLWRSMDVYGEADVSWLVAPMKQFLAARTHSSVPNIAPLIP